jgi:hypothetical protein
MQRAMPVQQHTIWVRATEEVSVATTMVAHPWVIEGQRRVRFGTGMLGARRDWGELIDWALEAEALGFDGWWS